MITWGLAYSRKSIVKINYLNTENIKFEEIINLTEYLVNKANQTRKLLKNSECRSEKIIPFFSEATKGYNLISNTLPELKYEKPSIKIGFNKTILSYLSTGGIYSFISGEANINANNSAYEAPFTISHEMAHQLGFASEDEANYISYLACTSHPNTIFKYSAYAEALNYSLNTVYQQDSTLYFKLKSKIDTAVLGDFAYSKAKWIPYQIPWLRRISSSIYDSFLKSNDQEKGILSYSAMVELLVADRRKKK